MALILRAYASAQKRPLCENLGNFLLYTRTCNDHSVKTIPAAAYNVKFFSSKDHKVPTGRTQIYHGNLTKQVRNIKIFSLLTSAGGLLAQPLLYLKAMENNNTETILSMSLSIVFLSVITPLIIHAVFNKYVTHLYYDEKEDKYIANTYSLFARTNELEFKPDDVIVPEISRMFTNCIIKGKPVFLDHKLFSSSDYDHYIKIMGYDKPVDFKLSNKNNLVRTVSVNAEHKSGISKK